MRKEVPDGFVERPVPELVVVGGREGGEVGVSVYEVAFEVGLHAFLNKIIGKPIVALMQRMAPDYSAEGKEGAGPNLWN